ncbi:MAG: P-type ATPase, partial [Promethearchaeota archaeon]
MIESESKNNGYYYQPLEKLIKEFDTDIEKGLSIGKIEISRQKFGYNELPKVKKSIWKIYLAPLFNFLIVILLITGIVVTLLGSPESTIATVIRDGKQQEIPTRELVPGDIIVLKQGDKIPADGRLIEAMNLSIDEAPLTGESVPVEKQPGIIDKKNREIQKQTNMVFMGTYVHSGRGKALITATGINT